MLSFLVVLTGVFGSMGVTKGIGSVALGVQLIEGRKDKKGREEAEKNLRLGLNPERAKFEQSEQSKALAAIGVDSGTVEGIAVEEDLHLVVLTEEEMPVGLESFAGEYLLLGEELDYLEMYVEAARGGAPRPTSMAWLAEKSRRRLFEHNRAGKL